MFKKLICSILGHKIDPFSIVEWAMTQPIKCCRCDNQISNEFLKKKWNKSKCSGNSIYSYKEIKNAIKRYKNTKSIYNYRDMPDFRENQIEYYMDKK